MEEISIILKDELVAKFMQKDNVLEISFLNGQNFRLELSEI